MSDAVLLKDASDDDVIEEIHRRGLEEKFATDIEDFHSQDIRDAYYDRFPSEEPQFNEDQCEELVLLWRGGNMDAVLERLRVLLMDATGKIL